VTRIILMQLINKCYNKIFNSRLIVQGPILILLDMNSSSDNPMILHLQKPILGYSPILVNGTEIGQLYSSNKLLQGKLHLFRPIRAWKLAPPMWSTFWQ
jgi:hypothetical protein